MKFTWKECANHRLRNLTRSSFLQPCIPFLYQFGILRIFTARSFPNLLTATDASNNFSFILNFLSHLANICHKINFPSLYAALVERHPLSIAFANGTPPSFFENYIEIRMLLFYLSSQCRLLLPGTIHTLLSNHTTA